MHTIHRTHVFAICTSMMVLSAVPAQAGTVEHAAVAAGLAGVTSLVEQPAGDANPPAAAPRVQTKEERTRAARLQTYLARNNFSPGLIDGKLGRKTKIAIEQFQAAKSIDAAAPSATNGVGLADEATLAALGVRDAWTRVYRITDADAALITGPVPTDWNERAALTICGYADLQELLAERGWCSTDLVAWLNPSLSMAELKPGDDVTLPDVPDPMNPKTKPSGAAKGNAANAAPVANVALPRLHRIEIDLAEKLVRGFNEAGDQVSLMHCSIAKSAEKRPAGELKVKVVAMDPEYTFDPKDWPEVQGITTKLRIPPGPRNPVGAAWIGLDKPGYGMHGTVRPQDIGKTGSHGCFRLANWDAVRLARAVRVGMVVQISDAASNH